MGSPPRARGAPDRAAALHEVVGLTPAGAGSTSATTCAPSRPGAHPRGRGEHDDLDRAVGMALGSPPRARGARPVCRRRQRLQGLTPAGAGSTIASGKQPLPIKAHPRGRGEHHSAPALMTAPRGSPPRARGAPSIIDGKRYAWGLTPAGAGSTRAATGRTAGAGAHPRGRGEHARYASENANFTGSPPRARGAPLFDRFHAILLGLTPAGAGSTRAFAASDAESWAHPRGRGEHRRFSWRLLRGPGSPPRARGALPAGPEVAVDAGLTPAGAGSTMGRPRTSR